MPSQVIGSMRVVGDGLANLDDADKLRIMDLVDRLRSADIPEGWVLLVEPSYPELAYGPYGANEEESAERMVGNIQFHGGTWMGPAEHPLLAGLMKSHRELIELRPAEKPAKVYSCPDCDFEADTKAKVAAHQKVAHK